MSISVAKLRVWLLVGAGLLVGVIAAFVGVAHYKAHKFIKDLPGKLGIDIQQDSTGFTASQSKGSKTIYTIHAAKAQKRKDGKLALHDVGIVLYGSGQGAEQRVDRIYGNEFEYDQSQGVVRAIGEVHIDLQAPAPVDANARVEYAKGHGAHTGGAEDEHLIHVITSELVFLQKLGTAATSQDLEFEYNGIKGRAHGADYSTDSGDLVLEQAVKVSGVKDGQPVVLTADRAELEREKNQLSLAHAVYTITGGKPRTQAGTNVAGTRVVKAAQVTAFLRPDGTVERALGEGGVSLVDDDGTTVTAARGEVHLNGANQPQTASLAGGVHYVADDPLRQARADAEESHAEWDKNGLLKHAVLTGAVHLHERRLNEAGTGAGTGDGVSERDLVSKALDLVVASEKNRRSQLQQAQAAGSARLTVVSAGGGGKASSSKGGVGGGKRTSVLSGDLLTVLFRPGDLAAGGVGAGSSSRVETRVKTVVGDGHTVLRRVNEDGAEATSSGDKLEVAFRDVPAAVSAGTAAKKPGEQGTEEIASAVQQGHVSMMNRPAVKAGSADVAIEQHATAQRATYDGDADELTLTGAVQLNDADSMLWADKVVMEHVTGDGTAEGSVRATYLQAKDSSGSGTPAEPVHVLAARGEFKHEARRAVFYGAGDGAVRKPARLWEGVSQVVAPVIEFERPERRFLAHGDVRSAGMVVHAVFVSGAMTSADKTAKGDSKQTPVRVASRDLIYDDVARRADFSGGVLVEDVSGTLRAQQAAVFLKPADAAKGSAATTEPAKASAKTTVAGQGAFMGGSVERMVASGGIEIVQPGRRVTGEQLVYTAVDGMSVITGRSGVPPKMTDVAQGVITGASLRFHAGDNSVVVSNGPDGVAGQRVRTDTRVKQ